MINLRDQKLTDEQKRKLWEFENWLLEFKIGTPKHLPINIKREFDPSTMMAYELNNKIFILELDEIPSRFLRA